MSSLPLCLSFFLYISLFLSVSLRLSLSLSSLSLCLLCIFLTNSLCQSFSLCPCLPFFISLSLSLKQYEQKDFQQREYHFLGKISVVEQPSNVKVQYRGKEANFIFLSLSLSPTLFLYVCGSLSLSVFFF